MSLRTTIVRVAVSRGFIRAFRAVLLAGAVLAVLSGLARAHATSIEPAATPGIHRRIDTPAPCVDSAEDRAAALARIVITHSSRGDDPKCGD